MTGDSGHWAALLQWILGNPEKGALFLVILAGAWRWLRELRRDAVDDQQHETFTEMLMCENKELRAELRDLRRKNGLSNGNHEEPK